MRRFFLFAFLTACSDTLFYQPEYPLVGKVELICDGRLHKTTPLPEKVTVFHFVDSSPSIYGMHVDNKLDVLIYYCFGDNQTLLLYREY